MGEWVDETHRWAEYSCVQMMWWKVMVAVMWVVGVELSGYETIGNWKVGAVGALPCWCGSSLFVVERGCCEWACGAFAGG
jgi:hypothetical protein